MDDLKVIKKVLGELLDAIPQRFLVPMKTVTRNGDNEWDLEETIVEHPRFISKYAVAKGTLDAMAGEG